jgi:hypothetical protein
MVGLLERSIIDFIFLAPDPSSVPSREKSVLASHGFAWCVPTQQNWFIYASFSASYPPTPGRDSALRF